MSLEKVDECPLCREKFLKPFLLCKDHTVSGELFHVEQCANCGMTLTNPRPAMDEAGGYYQSSQYISHSSKSSSLIDRIYLIIRYFTIIWKYRLVKPYLQNNTLLDIGCGTGNFAGYCKTHQIDAYGIEPSSEARTKTTEQRIKVFEALEELPDVKFSVITLWHVLEHIYSLHDTLAKIKNLLADNGIIFIAVPNLESEDAKHYKEFWAGYDVPRHVWHFSKNSMEDLLLKSGLKLVHKEPLKLDAYYVSMLSEKYKAQGKLSIVNSMKAVFYAIKSNWKAKSKLNYSSIIYMAQK